MYLTGYFAKLYPNFRDYIIGLIVNRTMKKLKAPNYAIIAVNYIQSLDRASIIKLIMMNAGFNKYFVLLVYILLLI